MTLSTPPRERGRRALWAVSAAVCKLTGRAEGEQSLLQSRIASVRMRTGVAALAWRRAGNENVYWNPQAAAGHQPAWADVGICIVPKFYQTEPLEPWGAVCEAAKEHGCPLVVDITDYPFAGGNEHVHAFYRRALSIADAVVVNSARMAELIAPELKQAPRIIDDAILSPARNPEFAPAGRLRLAWFGHGTNLRYLNAWLEALLRFAQQKPCRLTVVTSGDEGAEQVTRDLDARCAPALEVRFAEWSLEAMAAALRRCDIAFIPGDPADPFKAGVSSNRLAEALRAGRFPVASSLPSYRDFADAAWLGEDLIEGLAWALSNPAEVRARIRRGQARVAETLAPERLGGEWLALLDSLARAE